MNRQKARFGGPFCLPVRQRTGPLCCPCLRESRARLPAAHRCPADNARRHVPPAPHDLPLRCADRHTTLRPALLPFPRRRLPILPLHRRYRSGTDGPVGRWRQRWVCAVPGRIVVCQENRAHLSLFKGRRHFRMLLATRCPFSHNTSRESLERCCCPAAGQHLSEPCRKR